MDKKAYHYLVAPFDVLFFRNNRAFDFGEWYSEGLFPPLPSTFQGFVRTSILLKNGLIDPNGDLKSNATSVVGDNKNFPFELQGPYLLFTKSGHHFFITPADIVLGTENNCPIARQIQLSPSAIQTDIGLLNYADEPYKIAYLHYSNIFISMKNFENYRRYGKFIPRETEIVKTEEHFGIRLEPKTKTAAEHHFYLTPFKRLMSNVFFYFSISSENHTKFIGNLAGQYGRLGSEGRGVVIQNSDKELNLRLDDEFYQQLANEKKFKIILLQPGIFPDGWLPFRKVSHSDSQDIIMEHENIQLKLMYVSMPQNFFKISGMNFRSAKTNKGYSLKPMVNAVPPGTVYYFEVINCDDTASLMEFFKKLDGAKIRIQGDPNDIYVKMGYNQVVLGKII